MPDRTYTEWFRFTSEALLEDSFHVIRFTGTEGLNRLFSFTVELASQNADIDTEALLNTPAEFTILRENAPPAVFKGYPTRVEQGGHFGNFTFYTVELRPAFWKLTQIRQSAIFLNKTVQETANDLLNSQRFFSFPHEFRFIREYPVQEFAMQYEESLFDYILFRMEEQGAYFYFAPEGDRVIFADAPQSHDTATARLAYSPASGLDFTRREEVLQAFSLVQTPLPRQVVVRCYDWKNPNRVIVGKAEVSPNGLGDVYLAGENAKSEAEAKRLAKIRAEELACRSRVFTGSGSVPVLRPGLVFSLEDHYSKSFNRDYLVTEIRHEGAQEAYLTLGLGIPLRQDGEESLDHYFYRNSFSCIPSDLPYRPERVAPRAKISGVLRAFVDGAANKRAEMDEYGRYKLVFPFDLSGRKGGNASCWIRMAGPQANRDSGLAFPLLPGAEVVVSFIDGDPDRPLITGALPNGETGSISGQGNANISGIRTAGGNQITFNDADKQQGIALSTAAGLGYRVSSGSLGLTSEDSDAWLKAASVGGAEVAGAFKDVVTGFKIKNAVYEHNSWYGWTTTGATALGGVTAGVMDALAAKKVGNKGEEVKWTSAAVKALIPVLATGVGSYGVARAAGKSYYGAAISAKKDEVTSTIQVRPSMARLLPMILAWILPRVGATVLDAIKGDEDDDKKDKDDDVYYGKVKADAIREVMVSATSELVAEITALVTLLMARSKQATHLGGVSISSSDNNVNIRGKEVVSVHSETGILLDTTQSVEDASKWGAPSAVNGMRQSLGNMWPDNTVVPKPPDDGKYVVVNATRGALGLFAQDAQLVTQGQWVSQAPTHILKSSQENAPKAMLTMKDAADGSLEAKVSASGKILLTRGDANDGQSLTLSNNECILKNGSDVKYTLARATASLTTKNSALSMYSDSVSLRGKNATVECKPSAIDIDPGSSGSAKVCGITFQRTNLKADGALKLDAGIIKIG